MHYSVTDNLQINLTILRQKTKADLYLARRSDRLVAAAKLPLKNLCASFGENAKQAVRNLSNVGYCGD